MDELKHAPVEALAVTREEAHEGFAFVKRTFVPRTPGGRMTASVYELAPGKAAYPYHYHIECEELFFILSGQGTLSTPQGERPVRAGDLLHFPACEQGAHKLTNTSAETLRYLDVDTCTPLDMAVYPASGKVGVFGPGISQIYREKEQTDYYDGE